MQSTLANSGAETLQLLQQAAAEGRPNPLLIIDANMPEMDGFSLVREIRRDARLANIAIMMLTSAGRRGKRHCAVNLESRRI